MKRSCALNVTVAAVAVVLAMASAAGLAQDFTAGKTPPQLFSSDCSACHRSPAGLAKGRDARTLAGFLREHYTTKAESASALGAYVATYNGRSPPPPPPPPEPRAHGRDGDVAGNADEGHSGRVGEEPRRRRTESLSGDGEKRRTRDDAPRPPGPVATTESLREGIRSARATAAAIAGKPRTAVDPLDQIRTYLGSGLTVERTAEEAAKIRPANARRRNTAQPRTEPRREPAGVTAPPEAGASAGANAAPASPTASAAISGGSGLKRDGEVSAPGTAINSGEPSPAVPQTQGATAAPSSFQPSSFQPSSAQPSSAQASSAQASAVPSSADVKPVVAAPAAPPALGR